MLLRCHDSRAPSYSGYSAAVACLLECEGGCLASPDGPHWQPLALDATDGDGDKLAEGGGANEQRVVELDHSLHARP